MSNPQATKGYTATEALDYARIVIREADAGRCDTPRAEMLAREVVRLNEWADTWSDAALKERATANALIKELQAKLSARPEAPRITEAEAAQFLDDGFAIKVINAAPADGRNQGRNYWRCPHCQMADFDGHEQSCVIRALVERLLGRHVPFGQLSIPSPLAQINRLSNAHRLNIEDVEEALFIDRGHHCDYRTKLDAILQRSNAALKAREPGHSGGASCDPIGESRCDPPVGGQ